MSSCDRKTVTLADGLRYWEGRNFSLVIIYWNLLLQLGKATRCLFSTYAYLDFIKPRFYVRKVETILINLLQNPVKEKPLWHGIMDWKLLLN